MSIVLMYSAGIVKSIKLVLFLWAIVLAASASSFSQCPSITVIGPSEMTNPGERMTFRVELDRSDVKFLWSVSAGTITAGQGTPTIVVATDNSMAGSNVTATVYLQGIRPGCSSTASESAPVAKPIVCGLVMDEWERLRPNDERARLDSFFTELSNNPLNIGVVVFQVSEEERFDAANKRLRFVVKHAKFREFDLNRIWFVLDRSAHPRTKVYRVPPGAEMMPCDGICITIKGGDL